MQGSGPRFAAAKKSAPEKLNAYVQARLGTAIFEAFSFRRKPHSAAAGDSAPSGSSGSGSGSGSSRRRERNTVKIMAQPP